MNKKTKRKNLSPGALTAPLPPALVTVGNEEHSNVLTIGWTGILATVPPRTYVSIRPSRYSHGILKEGGEFVINLPSADMAREVDFAGIYTGAKMDKFEKCGFTRIPSEKVSAPTIAECPVSLECRVYDVVTMGSHDVFFADIVSVSCREDIIDEAGKMRFDKANLLAYAHGEYYTLGERIGRFGFSTDKPARSSETNKSTKQNKADRSVKTESVQKSDKPQSSDKSARGEEKKPFYATAPRTKGTSAQGRQKKKNPDKGKPHGKRVKK